jgi:hypothetical protein
MRIANLESFLEFFKDSPDVFLERIPLFDACFESTCRGGYRNGNHFRVLMPASGELYPQHHH